MAESVPDGTASDVIGSDTTKVEAERVSRAEAEAEAAATARLA